MQRYEKFADIIKVSQGKRRYSTIYYPKIAPKTTDIYIITKQSDRLDSLAYQYYGDTRLWVIIAKANLLHNATIRVPVGRRIRIPFPLSISDVNNYFRENQF